MANFSKPPLGSSSESNDENHDPTPTNVSNASASSNATGSDSESEAVSDSDSAGETIDSVETEKRNALAGQLLRYPAMLYDQVGLDINKHPRKWMPSVESPAKLNNMEIDEWATSQASKLSHCRRRGSRA